MRVGCGAGVDEDVPEAGALCVTTPKGRAARGSSIRAVAMLALDSRALRGFRRTVLTGAARRPRGGAARSRILLGGPGGSTCPFSRWMARR